MTPVDRIEVTFGGIIVGRVTIRVASSTSNPLHLHVTTYRCRDLPNPEMNEYVGSIEWTTRIPSSEKILLAAVM